MIISVTNNTPTNKSDNNGNSAIAIASSLTSKQKQDAIDYVKKYETFIEKNPDLANINPNGLTEPQIMDNKYSSRYSEWTTVYNNYRSLSSEQISYSETKKKVAEIQSRPPTATLGDNSEGTNIPSSNDIPTMQTITEAGEFDGANRTNNPPTQVVYKPGEGDDPGRDYGPYWRTKADDLNESAATAAAAAAEASATNPGGTGNAGSSGAQGASVIDSSGNIGSKTGGNGNVSVEGVDNSEERCQPSHRSEEEKFPHAEESANYIWAMPPVMSDPHDDSGKIGANTSLPLTSDYLYTLFENSFPILTLTPVKIFRPENSQVVNNVSEIGPRYKFAVSNDSGDISYSINNDYGPSMIENTLKEYMQMDVMSEFWQFLNTSRNTNNAVNAFENMINSSGVSNNIRQTVGNLRNEMDEAFKSVNRAANSNGITQTIYNLAEATINGIFRGHKIDIPNIWKGSSSSVSQSFKIVLHCTEPNNDRAFDYKIKKPLEILLKLALPYSRSTRGSSGENDIITYENPPYLKAELDGLFKSEICGITNMSISTSLKDQTMVKGGRPNMVTVTFSIQDLYEVILWADDKNSLPYSITGYDITDNMKDHERDELINPPHEMFSNSLMPNWYTPLESNNSNINNNYNNRNNDLFALDDIRWNLLAADAGMITVDEAIQLSLGTHTEANRFTDIWSSAGPFTIDDGKFYTDAGTAWTQLILSDEQLRTINTQPVTPMTYPENYGGSSF